MSKCLSNNWLLIIVAMVIIFASLTESYLTKDYHWFVWSGACVTIIGIILTARPIIRMGYKRWQQRSNIIDGGHLIPTPEEIEAERQSNEDDKAYIFGMCMTAIGTLILTFGDLIAGLLK